MRAATIQQQLRLPQLPHPALVEDAFGIQAVAVLATLDAECASVERLGEATAAAFTQHPDHRIITSFVGLADLRLAPPTHTLPSMKRILAPAYSPKSATTEHDSPTPEH